MIGFWFYFKRKAVCVLYWVAFNCYGIRTETVRAQPGNPGDTHSKRPVASAETFTSINLISTYKLQWVSKPSLPHTLPHMIILV